MAAQNVKVLSIASAARPCRADNDENGRNLICPNYNVMLGHKGKLRRASGGFVISRLEFENYAGKYTENHQLRNNLPTFDACVGRPKKVRVQDERLLHRMTLTGEYKTAAEAHRSSFWHLSLSTVKRELRRLGTRGYHQNGKAAAHRCA